MAISPHPLRDGATIAAISPAGPVGEREARRGVALLERKGYNVELLPSALSAGPLPYLAATDRERARDVERAFLERQYDAIICTRGGYGSMRLLPHLDFAAIKHNVHLKPFVGFSDLTVLQWTLWDRCRRITFSGPQLACGFGGDDRGEGYGGLDKFSGDCWFAMLGGGMWGGMLPLPPARELIVERGGMNPLGPLLGGNLAVLAALCGTEYAVSFAGGIALLEEIDEPPYRIDRLLTQLVLSGAFRGARGILLGRFTQHLQDQVVEHDEHAAKLLFDLLPEIPIVRGAPYGHVGPCWTIPIGAEATLDLRRGTLTVEKGE